MRKVTIIRVKSFFSDQGTFGHLVVNDFTCRTLELPWRDNTPTLSCIPLGEYYCVFIKSPKFGWTYSITNVLNRSHILFHSGNYAGDIKKGFRTDSWGCILLGKYRGTLGSQGAVLVSRVTFKKFILYMNKEKFHLSIVKRMVQGC